MLRQVPVVKRLKKNDVYDCVLWPSWCRVCLLIVLLPGGDAKRKDDAFARACNERLKKNDEFDRVL